MDLWHVPVEDLAATQQRALLRLHLKVTGDTHRILWDCLNNLKRAIDDATDDETGGIDLRKVDSLLAETTAIWGAAFGDWVRMFEAARRVAVWLPVGQLARLHDHYFGALTVNERRRLEEQLQIGLGFPTLNEEGTWDPVFHKYGPVIRNVATRMEAILDGGAALKYSDGHTLSDRLWRAAAVAHGDIQSKIRGGIGRNDSAWTIAKRLERELYVSERCPRWTSTRLGLTKAEIAAGDKRGLISGPSPCDSKGVAYNALRLARNEIQIAHHMATDEVFAAMPWVNYEYIRLSPDHPDIGCECESIVIGGPNNNGSYPKGEIILPVHVQCLCYKEARLMHPKTFATRAGEWMRGERDYPALDEYMGWLGISDAGPISLGVAPAKGRPGQAPAQLFPADLSHVRKVRDLGGSTGAELVEDEYGRQFVMKRGASPEHLLNECQVDAMYQEMGAQVPRFQLYEDERGRPVKLAEFLQGTPLGQLDPTSAEYARAVAELREHFALDALLGNWDVIGAVGDNVLVDAEGHAWRIDNGGALVFRAMGGRKRADQWSPWLQELWSMRDPTKNSSAAGVYGPMGWDEIFNQMVDLDPSGHMVQTALARVRGMGLPHDVEAILLDRFDQMQSLTGTTATMIADHWKTDYLDVFCRHLTEIRARGITAALPDKLLHTGVNVRDENGMPWDRLRGRQSVIHEVDQYMKELGGSWDTVAFWMNAQGHSSWNGGPLPTKLWMARQREVPDDAYYWGGAGVSGAEGLYDRALRKLGYEAIYRQTGHAPASRDEERQAGRVVWDGSYPVLHAFTYEMLQNVDFQHNYPDQGYIRLGRTEDENVRSTYNLHVGDTKVYTHGALESTSVFQTVEVAGNNLTLQEVPHQRVLGTYLYESHPGSGLNPFWGDSENEFAAMLEGIPSHYVARAHGGEALSRYWKMWNP
jgi:hypothetical protein